MVLLVGAEGVVDVPLQVDGQVGDPEQRPGDVNQPVHQPAVTLQEDDAFITSLI